MRRKIADLLSNRPLAALPPSATVVEAARLMAARHCGAVLVMDGPALAGIFTERDLVTRVVAEERDPAALPLAAVMTRDPDRVSPATLALAGLQMMEDGNYRHLPVVEAGRVVGVVSRRDFFGEEKAELERERDYWERMG